MDDLLVLVFAVIVIVAFSWVMFLLDDMTFLYLVLMFAIVGFSIIALEVYFIWWNSRHKCEVVG